MASSEEGSESVTDGGGHNNNNNNNNNSTDAEFVPDSRKRPLDVGGGGSGESESGVPKRTHHGGGSGDGTFHFKILVPSVAAGAIIGKGGETIAQLQKETGARVKMSKANDFYPGTCERVCLISGTAEAVLLVHTFIMEKIREKPDPNAKPAIDFDNKQPAERERQVKILVPNSTAGMIIGKGGNYIKQIKEESGAYVQISQKAKDQSLTERCITVIGEMDSNRQASAMILAKIMEDPQSGSCLNVSYADVTGPIANFNPTGSPFANAAGGSPTGVGSGGGGGGNYSPNNNSSVGSFGSPGCTPMSAHVSGVNFNLSAMIGGCGGGGNNPPLNLAQYLENTKALLRSNGFSEQATADIASAVNTLATYGVLGLGLNSVLQMNNNPTGLGLNNPIVNGLLGNSGGGGGVAGATGGNSGGGGGNSGSNSGGANNSNMAMDTTPAGPVPTNNGIGAAAAAAAAALAAAANNNSVFGPIGSMSGGSPTLGMSSPTTPRPNDHGPDSYDPFRRTSPSLHGPGTANLHVINNNSFGLGTNAAILGLRKSPTSSSNDKLQQQMQQQHQQQQQQAAAAAHAAAAAVAAAQIMGTSDGGSTVDMEVGENIVGAILGPGGKSLVEIQHFSGANIQISKKGIFAPGTRNRIVTITGSVNAVGTAHYLIEQRISEEETKRARQNLLGVVH